MTDKENPKLPRLHVVFVDGDHAFLCVADPRDGSPWPLGIPRLKLLADAPSRSALKLEEALLTLLDGEEREALLKAGMTAADLGAAPGGWTWILTRHHLRVTSVDNGPLRQNVMDSGLVEHLRADGFQWKPSQPLDWMVCDMVEQPRRVAGRMATWFREGWCRHAVFNLKLPMKKRWDETRLCLDLFAEQSEKPVLVRAKQLYHDREEITVFATGSYHPGRWPRPSRTLHSRLALNNKVGQGPLLHRYDSSEGLSTWPQPGSPSPLPRCRRSSAWRDRCSRARRRSTTASQNAWT